MSHGSAAADQWTAASWRGKTALQQPPYPDPAALEPVLDRLRGLPGLVSYGEIELLKRDLAQAEAGKRFILQGGDCAERFIDCTGQAILDKFKILLQMSVVLTYGLRKGVIKIGRLAGQYGKPRSKPTEDGPQGTIHSYFGDNVNSYDADPQGRIPEPGRLLDGYMHAAATLNYLRSLLSGGFADLHHPQTWNLDAIKPSPRNARYAEITGRILDAISFMESFGGVRGEELGSTEFFVSHEGLHLPWEEAMVRSHDGRNYASSAHFLWIGERTRQLDGAHVEFFRGLANPVGVKVGPSMKPRDLCDLAAILNPQREHGKLVLISRLGAGTAGKVLPGLLSALGDSGIPAIWICDPMHGNTVATARGVKTRSFDRILAELTETAAAHRFAGGQLGGVHFELTGDDVTECLGGPGGLSEDDLDRRYETWCDPRLNYAQSLEMAFRLLEL